VKKDLVQIIVISFYNLYVALSLLSQLHLLRQMAKTHVAYNKL